MQQIREGHDDATTNVQTPLSSAEKTESLQKELNTIFLQYEELHAAFFFYGSAFLIPTGFFGSIIVSNDPEKAMLIFGSMYIPFFCSIVLRRPARKIRKYLYLYMHHRHESWKELQDPWDERV